MTRWLAMVFLVACSGTAEGTDRAPRPPLPTSCAQADRVGTYRFTYVEQSGNCGPLPSQLVSLNPPAPGDADAGAGAGCTVNSERWSEGDCKLERDITCTQSGGPTIRTIAVTRAQTADGSELAGTASFTVGGPSPCGGTYALDAVRQ